MPNTEKEFVAEEVVAEDIVAGVEAMSVEEEEDEDEIVDGKIVVRLPGDRKRRVVGEGEEERVWELREEVWLWRFRSALDQVYRSWGLEGGCLLDPQVTL